MASALHQAAWLVSSVGAINWGAVELLNTNLITDTLGLGTGMAGIVYIVIAIAGLLSLYNFYEGEVSM